MAVFEETSGLFPVPTETRESVAQVLDAILVDTQPMLDALSAGAIRDAFIDHGFVAAFQAMQTACQAG